MKRTSILAVDGEPGILELLRAELESRGYAVLCASDGLEALQMFASKEPDLVILNILLGKLDGFEVCCRLRNFSMVPAIMPGARSDPADKTMAMECVADDCLLRVVYV